jgi:hypothetical protein
MMVVVMVMMMASTRVMMVHERQLAAGSDGCLLHDRRRGCREREACRRDCGDDNMPDVHKNPP